MISAVKPKLKWKYHGELDANPFKSFLALDIGILYIYFVSRYFVGVPYFWMETSTEIHSVDKGSVDGGEQL